LKRIVFSIIVLLLSGFGLYLNSRMLLAEYSVFDIDRTKTSTNQVNGTEGYTALQKRLQTAYDYFPNPAYRLQAADLSRSMARPYLETSPAIGMEYMEQAENFYLQSMRYDNSDAYTWLNIATLRHNMHRSSDDQARAIILALRWRAKINDDNRKSIIYVGQRLVLDPTVSIEYRRVLEILLFKKGSFLTAIKDGDGEQ